MKTSPAVPLDSSFWQNFAKNIWEKEAMAIKNVASPLLELSAAEIFDLLVQYSDRCRRAKDATGFKFYIDGFKVDADEVLQVLPQKKDKSLLGYHKRMAAEFVDYCLVCDELLRVNLNKQHLLTDFTDQLYRHVGFPNRFSEMGLYLGNYRQTPFGVHVDSCGVFSFAVVGQKKFRLWPAGFGQKNPALDRAFKYEKFKKHSYLLEAGPGDMTYWPSSAWHIAESDGSFSATWSLGVWVDQPHKNMFTDALKEILDQKLKAVALAPTTAFKNLHASTGQVRELPEAYQESLLALQNLTTQELEEGFLKSWMRHISLQGFKTIPVQEMALTFKSKIKLRNDRALILWQQSQTQKNVVYCSFGGALVQTAKSTGFLKLIQAVNAGESCELSAYLKGPQRTKDLADLQVLADAGAFR